MSVLARNLVSTSTLSTSCPNIVSSYFHSSSALQKKGWRPNPRRPSARTRLVNDLNPKGASSSRGHGKLEVAPRTSTSKAPTRQSSSAPRNPTVAPRDTSFTSQRKNEKLRRKSSVITATQVADRVKSSIERDFAPHLSEEAHEGRSAPYERVRNRADIEDKLVTPSSKSQSEVLQSLPNAFESPPLLEGMVSSLHNILGRASRPTPIQALSIKHIVSNLEVHIPDRVQERRWNQFLLASETGSGKSFAYMLPLLQDLKSTELNPFPDQARPKQSRAPLNPRAIILAPTHELSRQLTSFAKSLSHAIKLRIMSASRANTPNISLTRSASKMAQDLERIFSEGEAGSEMEVTGQMNAGNRDTDVLVSTPMKLLEMLRGRYWQGDDPRSARMTTPKKPEVGFERVEWVVVDEADVLFDPDFRDFTQDLLADISRQRGHPRSHDSGSMTASPIHYPFHLVLTTATIPAMLNTYLETNHPSMMRLASPNLHRLPRTLKRETVGQSTGNRNADVEKRIRQVWAEDAAEGRELSRIVVFCNRSTKVQDLCAYLEKEGVKCVEITSTGEARKRGSNKHLTGFLKSASPATADGTDVPRVLVTTSLLSRGLDFAPSVSHVFILDEPRNKVDFLHRAGRTARAGLGGTVVVFGKGGKAADLDRDLKRVRH
ncbi:P-loop containing nucleoside triphosphate hydrolase protein [Neolentinus lepideus HHB14362 ss-1]|uniref:RNA helicase n=1 Tax=Neolentinus lepideus HHB14362 ss-1 TaxID=1314782 RepID=A0A165RUQ6_9AGAM|nr:P-loop containing nucleoside triphosphate hydrolase protein [Neolentinus lepideus HHB14362 ss-1]